MNKLGLGHTYMEIMCHAGGYTPTDAKILPLQNG